MKNFDSRCAGIEGDKGRVARPKYIWVRLYKLDGTIRWLNACDWKSGNLVITAERTYGLFTKPILIRKPEEIWKGILIRYSMDTELMKALLSDAEGTASGGEGDAIKTQ